MIKMVTNLNLTGRFDKKVVDLLFVFLLLTSDLGRRTSD